MLKLSFRIVWTVVRVWWRVAVTLCVVVLAVVFFQAAIAQRTLRAVGR